MVPLSSTHVCRALFHAAPIETQVGCLIDWVTKPRSLDAGRTGRKVLPDDWGNRQWIWQHWRSSSPGHCWQTDGGFRRFWRNSQKSSNAATGHAWSKVFLPHMSHCLSCLTTQKVFINWGKKKAYSQCIKKGSFIQRVDVGEKKKVFVIECASRGNELALNFATVSWMNKKTCATPNLNSPAKQ